MGHVVGYLSEREKCNRAMIEDSIREMAERNGDGYPGRPKWHDEVKPLPNRDAAEKWISAHDRGWYDDHAVRYIDHSNYKTTKKITELQEKAREICEKQGQYTREHSVKNFKAEYIGCQKCGSKLSREWLRSEKCPLCGEDLRSKTTLDTIRRYEERRQAVIDAVEAEKEKQTGEVRWLIKYEYHC